MKLKINRQSLYQSIFSLRLSKIYIAVFVLLFGVGAEAFAQTNYTIIDYPGSNETEASGINDAGDVIGYSDYPASHGFKWSNGVFTIIDPPGSTFLILTSGINTAGDVVGYYNYERRGFKWSNGIFTFINPPNSDYTTITGINTVGEVVGYYRQDGRDYGFKWNNGVFTLINVPGSNSNYIKGINTMGEVVGFYRGTNGREHGFKWNNGNFTIIDPPGSIISSAQAINNSGDVAGHYSDVNRSHGFKWSNGVFTTIDLPGSVSSSAQAINNSGDVAGHYSDASNRLRGFKWSNGIFTIIDPPGSVDTQIQGINNSGDVVGFYRDASNRRHGFKFTNGNATLTATVQTNPAGRSFTVDGVNYNSTQTFNWQSGAAHTIGTTSPQTGSTGTQYVWSNWSDGGAISHTVSPTANATYTANFTALQITGRIAKGVDSLSGITVALSGTTSASTTTDGSGNFTFSNLTSGGNYTVTPSLPGYTFTPANQTFSNLTSNQTANFMLSCSSNQFNMNIVTATASSLPFNKKEPDDVEKIKQNSLDILSRNPKMQNLNINDSLTILKVDLDDLDMTHTRVRQVVNGIPVWEGEAIVHLDKDGSLATITDNLKANLVVNTEPKLSSKEAIEAAMSMYEGSQYLTEKPIADLWIYRGDDRDHLAYRVQMRREDGTAQTAMPVIFVDAQTGEKVFGYDNLKTGMGSSLYSGNVTVLTSSSAQTFYMEDLCRAQGTFNVNNTGNPGPGILSRFTNPDDFWNSAIQKAGVDAHYGAAKTLDYYKAVHNRNGIDGNSGPTTSTTTSAVGAVPLLVSRVHYGIGYNNAFWNGNSMTYGDGDGSEFSPLVSLDIAGHEMTHGVTEYIIPNGLTYAGESGALNESMSDVFGAMVELRTRGGLPSTDTWKIGEQVYTPGVPGDALRYMNNPTQGNQPDHYSMREYPGTCVPTTNNDNCGVHVNSGIANNAFYLAAVGGTHRLSGVTVTGIGTSQAEKIWYKAYSYMTSSTNFAGARAATLSAAAYIHGVNSAEYTTTARAWCAVGVGSCRPSFDFDGDGKADVSVFRPGNGSWYLQQSANGFTGLQFGVSTDKPVPADYDGDGKTDVAVFRPSNGAWYYLKSSDNTFNGLTFGQNGDIPIPGDFDGDGKADINVFRPSNGAWYRLNSSNGTFYGVAFGQNGDKPLIADFDGDGKSDIAVFRPANGVFYSLDSSTGAFRGTAFGFGTDVPTMGDFDGDGKTDIAVFRPSNGAWYRFNSSNGAFIGIAFGQNGDIPVAADYDGDGKADIAVFRPANGVWYLLNSSNGAFVGLLFGANGDKPIPAAFVQ